MESPNGITTKPPKTLTSKRTGGLKVPCRRLADIFQCPVCGAMLEFHASSMLWVCPASFHSRAVPHALLLRRLKRRMRALGYRRWTPRGIYRIQRRVSRWKWRHKPKTTPAEIQPGQGELYGGDVDSLV